MILSFVNLSLTLLHVLFLVKSSFLRTFEPFLHKNIWEFQESHHQIQMHAWSEIKWPRINHVQQLHWTLWTSVNSENRVGARHALQDPLVVTSATWLIFFVNHDTGLPFSKQCKDREHVTPRDPDKQRLSETSRPSLRVLQILYDFLLHDATPLSFPFFLCFIPSLLNWTLRGRSHKCSARGSCWVIIYPAAKTPTSFIPSARWSATNCYVRFHLDFGGEDIRQRSGPSFGNWDLMQGYWIAEHFFVASSSFM